MSNVVFQLEEQRSDLRADEIAYRFMAENRGPRPVHVRSLNPQAPEGVTLTEVRDTSDRAVRLRYRTLCDELTGILRSYLMRLDADKQKDKGTLVRIFGANGQTERTFDFVVENTHDAGIAIAKWFGTGDNEAAERNLFEAKLQQLVLYEQKLETDDSGGTIITLPSGSQFSTTYVFRFLRGKWDPRTYTVTIEGSYAEEMDTGPGIVETMAVSASTTISPRPVALSGVAVIASLLGAILKTALLIEESPASAGVTQTSVVARDDVAGLAGILGTRLLEALVSFEAVAGMVLAFLVFNIYEHTEFGSRVKMGVGWRSALLIGVLAGLFTERFLKALTVFIGSGG
jgi:hypothetical protein